MRRQSPIGRSTHNRLRLAVAVAAISGLGLSTVPSAVAEPTDPAMPSESEVAAAKQRVEDKGRDVGAIKASLVVANQRLEQAQVAEALAAEGYNEALWELDQARAEVREASAKAAEARRTVEEQRAAIGRLVAASYQRGGDLTALKAMMDADGPEGVLDNYATFQGASESLQADYDRFAASETLAQVFEQEAQEAKERQKKAAAKARAARDEASAAASSAAAMANQIAAEKDRLVRELAAAQDISVKLARQRQVALEEIARRKAAEAARREAAAAAAAQAAAEEAAAQKSRAAAKARARAKQRASAVQPTRDDPAPKRKRRPAPQPAAQPAPQPAPEPAPQPAPEPAPDPTPPAPSRSKVETAIDFAKRQIGEPYRWGATGPDSWDCSGLMLKAWQAAGVYLPRVSRSQYQATTPISLGNLRRGDLLFWGSSIGSIHHVGMYLGGGNMIHAPRTGRDVVIESMYSYMPDYFTRV